MVIQDYRLEADTIVFDTRVRDIDEPNFLVAGGDVGYVKANCLQAGFQLLKRKFLIVIHDTFLL